MKKKKTENSLSKDFHEGPEFDSHVSHSSDFARWLYQERESREISSNEKVIVVSDPDRFKNAQKRGLVVIPKLDFEYIDQFRHFPSDIEAAGYFPKQTKNFVIEEECSPQFDKKVRERGKEVEKSPAIDRPGKLVNHNQRDSVLIKPLAASTAFPTPHRSHDQSTGSLISKATLPKREIESADASRKNRQFIHSKISYWLFGVLLIVNLLDFFASIRAFPQLTVFIDELSNKIYDLESGPLIFSYVGLSLFLQLAFIPGQTILRPLLACKFPNFWLSFLLILFTDITLKNVWILILKLMPCRPKLEGSLQKNHTFECFKRSIASSGCSLFSFIWNFSFLPPLVLYFINAHCIKNLLPSIYFTNGVLLVNCVIDSLVFIGASSNHRSLTLQAVASELQPTGIIFITWQYFRMSLLALFLLKMLCTGISLNHAITAVVQPVVSESKSQEDSEMSIAKDV